MTINYRPQIALLVLAAALIISTATSAGAQPPSSPPPTGNRIVARDGDVVVVEDDARVRIVRRREASVRVIFDAAERWLLILADLAAPGSPADGDVDHTYYYMEVEGTWPFATPWTGVATIEEYSTTGGGGAGLGIVTPGGLVHLRHSPNEWGIPDAVAVLTHRRGGASSTDGGLAFDEAEQWYRAQLRRTDGVIRSPGGGITSLSGGLRIAASPAGAVRGSGNTRPPVKIVDVPPVMPEVAARANVRGLVILEVTVESDGTVKDPRVLRSIPLLDRAALDAVRQWRYEPAIVNGKPASAVITVSVTF